MEDAVGPTVSKVKDVLSPTPTAVDSVEVTFSEAVNPSTFDFRDLALTLNGGPNLITDTVTVAFVSGSTYLIGGLTGLTGAAGMYRLSVSAAGVLDLAGNAGTGSASTEWVNDPNARDRVRIDQVSPDPRKSAVASLNVTFTRPVDANTFDYRDLVLTRNGGPNLITGAVTVRRADDTHYEIANLAGLTDFEGRYLLKVIGDGIQYPTGTAAVGLSGEVSWTTDKTVPVASLADMPSSPRNTPVGSVTLNFNEPIDQTVASGALTLKRNGAPIALGAGVAIERVGPSSFRINGLGGLTAAEGVYTLEFKSSTVSDPAGNAADGSVSATWVTDLRPPVFSNVPPVIFLNSPTAGGLPVSFWWVSVRDQIDSQVTYTSSVPSGTVLAPGTSTPILFAATDRAGNIGYARTLVVVVAPDTTGPTVDGVRLVRGRGGAVRQVQLTVSETLDGSLATNAGMYRLQPAGTGGRPGAAVVVGSAAYDGAQTLTLNLRRPVRLTRPLLVRVSDDLADTSGNRLDGDRDGRPGGDFVARLPEPSRFGRTPAAAPRGEPRRGPCGA